MTTHYPATPIKAICGRELRSFVLEASREAFAISANKCAGCVKKLAAKDAR